MSNFRPLVMALRRASSRRPENIMNVFDRKAKQTQRNRTALLDNYAVYDYLKEEVGWRMADRLSDIKRKFNVAVDLGCGRGHIGKNVLLDTVGMLYQCDMADMVLAQSDVSPEVPTYKLIVDEEFIPFRDGSLDIVLSSLSMHWVNDLPGTFQQVHAALKNDGCFMGAMFGGDTLQELRISLQLAELEKEGGFGAHVSPFTSAQDLGSLLTRSGYVMLTIDVDEIIVNFPSMRELMRDLKCMGENNCAWSRRPMIRRDTMEMASAIYKEKFPSKDGEGIAAMFQILHFIGWKPDQSQRAPAKRGSGQVSLKDIDKLTDVSQRMSKLKDEVKDSAQLNAGDSSVTDSMSRTIAELERAIQKARQGTGEGDKLEGVGQNVSVGDDNKQKDK